MKFHRKIHNDQGFALMVVLIVLLLVTALAAEMLFTVRTGLQEGRQADLNSRSRGLARAGINLGLFHLLDKSIGENLDQAYIHGVTQHRYLSAGKIDFLVMSETGKIDLNRINRKFIGQFLATYKYDLREQEILTDSIYDWIDRDDLHRLQGAESEYYEMLSPPYATRNGRFLDPSELWLVRGAEKLVRQINPNDFFTIYNQTGRINFNMLSEDMLRVMTGDNSELVRKYKEQKKDGVLFGSAHAKTILAENYSKWQPYLAYSKGNNQYYTVIATGYAGLADPASAGHEIVKEKQKYPGCRIRLLLKLANNRLHYIRWSEEYIVE